VARESTRRRGSGDDGGADVYGRVVDIVLPTLSRRSIHERRATLTPMAVLHLLRHARPSPPREKEPDTPLSEQGIADAKALIEPLRSLNVSRIVSSPLRRALQTVEPFAKQTGLPVETDPRLREREMPLAKSPEEHIERVRVSFDDSDYAPPGGESFRQTADRALMCLQRYATETPSGLLLVGHGLCLTLIHRSLDLSADFDFWVALPTPAIVELTVRDLAGDGTLRLNTR
jgi:2,3-bisphosphoglycerate-dependent phosphoglycerate mutase